jgi:hypothetical protein
MTAMLNCPMLCATPPPTLIPTDENPLIFFKIPITIRLRIPPARLYAIVIGFPNRKPASTTRITEISRVLIHVVKNSSTMMTPFASPNLIPGIPTGIGINTSI